jgi:hypothetical protein
LRAVEYPEYERTEPFEDDIDREGRGIGDDMNFDGSLSEY